ncbi:type I restriction endonuclease EcoAI subunit S [Undibacterium sp. KW1]|uniref:restriction endonuclease subunit S n=1 Tax=Undibacterium sp. KW1 TaxID=2058624 RepID=UPI001331EA24|nr:restriction endonuclease subunit S [Undibacterium sp. KW1]BBB58461.1 type I restriction endonuclease EcoAI subunit S [Undibacterium sp. KW1]
MDAQQFLAEFGHIANAPGGMAQLRDLVLYFAVTGKLVQQTAVDEHAEILLERMRQTAANRNLKKRGWLAKKINGRRPLKEDSLSIGWVWAELGELGDWGAGSTPLRSNSLYYGGRIPWFKSGELKSDYITKSEEFVSDLAIKECSLRLNVPGDVLIAMYGANIGQTSITGIESTTNQAVCACTPYEGLNNRFLLITLRAMKRHFIGLGVGGAQPNISKEKIVATFVGLPPTKEQARIVAKVDEIMNLCDKLEAQQQARRKLQNNLRQSTLQAIARAVNPPDLQNSWARLSDNFTRLFHTPEDVIDLRQFTMDLAVRGLLTEQCDDDEPASNLLYRIALEHKEMVLKGEMKRPKPIPEIDLTEVPFELPRGWAWARFPEVGLFGRGKSKHRPRNDPKLFTPGIYPLVQTGEVARANDVINEYHSKYSDIGLAQSKLWPKGTLCITIAANIADAAILGFDACFPDSIVGFVPASEIRDEVEYFLLFMKTARERLLAFAPSTAQKNINLEILQSVLVPLPPKAEIKRILLRIKEINALCDVLMNTHKKAQEVGKLLADTSVANITGIAIEQKEESMKAPQTELIAALHLGKAPDIKAQAPLATILVRHNSGMPAKDLWQRFGGEIDAFYAQLKTEVEQGWILEPAVAEMREKQPNPVSV